MSSFVLNLINGLVAFIVIFVETRCCLGEVISYLYNRSAEKKRKKGQSFIDWFCYKNFKDRLPKKFYVWYYANFVYFFLFVVCMIALKAAGFSPFKFVTLIYFFTAHIPASYYWLMIRGLYLTDPHMENIVHKKHGNKKKKK